MVTWLLSNGHEVTTFDNLSRGYRDAVTGGVFIEGDLGNHEQLDRLFTATSFDAVMHFASFIEVGEWVKEPAKYYRNNLKMLDPAVKPRDDKDWDGMTGLRQDDRVEVGMLRACHHMGVIS
jgi:UDP-glucose 4-epimerase